MEKEHEEEQFTEQPEVYTVKKDLTGWRFNRRTFLAAAGATAAVAAVGTVTGCNEPTPQEQIVVVEVVATPSHTPPPVVASPIPPGPEVPSSPPPPGPTEAARPSDTPVPTPIPTDTPTPTADKPQAQFVKDVTIPDGTEMRPGQRFTKTWRYRNSGNVPWGEGVQLVFVEGTIQGYASHPMSGPGAVAVPNVAPGNTVDISVNLIAPDKPGRYRSYWRLRLPTGEWLENNHYVEIVVKPPATATPPPTATPPLTPTTACECVGHTGCQCDGHCAQHAEPRPTREKHYWHPN